MKGSILQNERYCSKEGLLVHFGLPFIGKGGRRDLQVYFDKVRAGETDLQLAQHDFGMFARTLKATDRIRLATKPPRVPKRDVWLFYGIPGSGKTRRAYDLYPDIYEKPVGDDLWFDGYQGEKQVLFDEFSGQCSLNNCLKLLDPEPIYIRKVAIKGGFVWFNPEVIIITTNNHPKDWYDYSKRMDNQIALRRRFSRVIHFQGQGLEKEYLGPNQIRNFWPIDAPPSAISAARLVNSSVVAMNPIQAARMNGTLCHQCYTVPCSCLVIPSVSQPESQLEIQVGEQCVYCKCFLDVVDFPNRCLECHDKMHPTQIL
jgi:hypothetical protein